MEIFLCMQWEHKNWKCFEFHWNKTALSRLNWLTLKFWLLCLNWLLNTQCGHMAEVKVWGQGFYWKRPRFSLLIVWSVCCYFLVSACALTWPVMVKTVLLTCRWSRWGSVDDLCKSVTMAGKTITSTWPAMCGEQNIYEDQPRRSQFGEE